MRFKVEIIYEDDAIVIVNKPPRSLTIPDRFDTAQFNLYRFLQDKYGAIFIVHRLDRETGGIVCFAKTEAAHRELCRQWEARTVDKVYAVLVQGNLKEDTGRLENFIADHPNIPGKMLVVKRDGKKSITEYSVVEVFKNYTLLDANIKTGRQHQIRVQFNYIGHPLAIDPLYAKKQSIFLSDIKLKYKPTNADEEQPIMDRLTLHARRLSFLHPTTGERVTFTAEPHKDFLALLSQLRKWGK